MRETWRGGGQHWQHPISRVCTELGAQHHCAGDQDDVPKGDSRSGGHHARYEYLFVRADGEQLREITRLVESGAIKPLVDNVFPLEQVRDALAYSESGRATGKVVIRVA